ncbi:MAG: nicotinate-nucleotide pyrophosphorylase (carboxylating) [Acidimicrobiales bacterium]|jgi:nicotinate-nucleotide pyrophosphorylase (carboxylating)
MKLELNPLLYEDLLRTAFAEDLGLVGDVTSDAIIPASTQATLVLRNREPGTIAGLQVAARAFTLLNPNLTVEIQAMEGTTVEAYTDLAVVSGSARSILTAERTALNLACRMSGIATQTRRIVDAVEGTGATVVCTRKTTPGLRAVEKYAVRAGGGKNHRFGLSDAVLIKDNHIAVAGSLTKAVEAARANVGHLMKIEVEVDTLEQLDELLAVGADVVLLDNMDPAMLTEAVAAVDGRMITEASGGITPDTARAKAESGVDLLSIGWLTHSSPILDIGLDQG